MFERRFRHVQCGDAVHLRNAIVYVHRNPVDAGICGHAKEYRWSSYASYFGNALSQSPPLQHPVVMAPLRLFAVSGNENFEELHAQYTAYADYVEQCRTAAPDKMLLMSDLAAGDSYWTSEFVKRRARKLNNGESWRPDLADLAKAVVRERAPGFTIQQLLLRRGGTTVSMLRHEIIRRAVRVGFRGVDIANYLHISAATVSVVAADEIGRPPMPPSDTPRN